MDIDNPFPWVSLQEQYMSCACVNNYSSSVYLMLHHISIGAFILLTVYANVCELSASLLYLIWNSFKLVDESQLYSVS